jgi:hypothetical protein
MNDEWGNISLPGLSDEDLYKTNWNKVAVERTKAADPVWQAKNKRSNQIKAQDPEWIAKNKRSNQIKGKDPVWLEKRREYYKTKQKRIMTPYGEFQSRNDAIRHMESLNISNAKGKVTGGLKTKPTEYYYLDK